MRRYRSRLTIAVAIAAATIAAACGSDDSSSSDTTASSPASAAETTAASSATSASPSSQAASTSAAPDDGPNTPEPEPLAQPANLKVAVSVNAEFTFAMYVAQQKGEFAKENLTVEIPVLPSAAQFQALANNDIDIIAAGVSAIGMNSIAAGIPAKTFLNTHDGPAEGSNEGIWVHNDFKGADGKLDAAKVDGMTVVLGTQGLANSNAYALEQMLGEVGKDIDDVELTVLQPGADSVIAIENQAVDAAQQLPPFADSASLPACCFLGVPGVSAGRYWAMVEDLEAQPEVFEAFARALLRTNRTYLQGNYHTNPETADLLAAFTGAPVEAITAAQSYYEFGTEALNETEIIEPLQTLWLEHSPNGEILGYEEPLPLDQIQTQDIVDAVNGQ